MRFRPTLVLTALLAGTLLPQLPAAVLTTVPMQGGMVMPMISYRAGENRLYITMPVEVPQLTPLLVSHPGDHFDPVDPWFDDLDPSRRGYSFSRRYGFIMDAMTDPLPDGVQIHIRKIEGPPELGFHRYSGSEPKMWEPIFGTAGSSDALAWNGLMFHPAVTAPPGTNSYEAVFEAYLVDTLTGEPLPGSSTGPFVLRWTNLPDGRPILHISPGAGAAIRLSWDGSAQGWELEQSEDLRLPTWQPVSAQPVLEDGRWSVSIEPVGGKKFYRLRLVR